MVIFMGMCLVLHGVSDNSIDKILESPPLIWLLIAPDSPDIYLEAVRNSMGSGFFSKIFGKKKEKVESTIPNPGFADGETIDCDLDKSWHGIHYCLNTTEYEAKPPLDFMLLGGKCAGDIDVGYGPARLFDSTAVKEIQQVLSPLTSEDLHRNFKPDEMERLDIYPNIWKRDGEEAFEYIAEHFELLKSFLARCVHHNLGMAVYLC